VLIGITHIGTATLLLEIGRLRLLTDPALDPPGGRYSFGFGASSRKLSGPAVDPAALGHIDMVLLTHDQHDDNLDRAGRQLVSRLGRVVTTRSGAHRLGHGALGLRPWETTLLADRDGLQVQVTATPARHGPPLSTPIVGDVIGFHLEWPGQSHGGLYISGDTVLFRGIEQVASRLRVGTAILHLGGVGFPVSGPVRYTFDGREAAEAARLLRARTVVPVHYDGWSHFREPREQAEAAFGAAGLTERVRWLPPGERVELEV
jgi:L-ascorbate metabolism protein UlaG (beta-lactamase superfamily)